MTESVRDREERAAEQARRWIVRMASGDMRPEELDQFKAWRAGDPLHDRAFEEARAIWRVAAGSPNGRALPLPSHSGWTRRRLFRSPVHRMAMTGAAAAIVAGLILGDDLSVMLRADHRTGTTVESVTLADGSRAVLNADTAIAVSYDRNKRRIELLRGDAWFEVAHGDRRPFRVAALGGETQDVGTAFEVRREDAAVSVAVTQGSVQVRSSGVAGSMSLRASESARYTEGAAPVRMPKAAPDTIAAWRKGEILFDRADVRSAIATIGRYRSGPVFIMGTPPSPRRISGAFRIHRPEEAIDAIAGMNGLAVYRLGSVAVLRPAHHE
ncbi:FecR domain-containing protein [Sphingomonas sp. 2R-10]|uniref:FecR family protein n=1 Tax=Sphingomonas sp. 2R-10 TaxID=3045148 RepID=UPI000F790E8F|nr:FecR domain-containing protein [Sphingomonas sp. 2R-10]MDJ0275272.1 FecR domain-containing protein [Sphingomonas sp. 2R-10]